MKVDETDWIITDSLVIKKLNKDLINLLSTPDSVKCYSIKYNAEKDSVGYIRDTQLAVLDCKQIAIIQYLLIGNPYNYEDDSIKIESPYIPIIEYEFIKTNYLSASVLISTSDRSWSLFCNNQVVFKHTYCDARMIERYCDYFLNEYSKNK